MAYSGDDHVYVLACAGFEDVLKVGMSRQPLVRWQSFHPRWFEIFELESSCLIRLDSRRESRACETRFHRDLAAHRCPAPLAMPMLAGGHSEWYRGAWARAHELAAGCEAAGLPVERDLRRWAARQMAAEQPRLYELLSTAAQMAWDGQLAPMSRRGLLDLVDAHAHFDPAVPERFAELLDALRNAGR
ncbi:GIY-YIG nuclease family protein [Marilutibacter chinensis]|uniref:GIY-YIG nuclease family protein n=1 Tax=Marilutibacter chinensis TaxID=2912247 RepID=A0ABS9HU35_9GAMM|nr:GIY-YIG nuclease family protein [Lysobacter chinensis]MCF7222223.1 GIY-YIG nuclease family protein [Lysobacter chinensis]